MARKRKPQDKLQGILVIYPSVSPAGYHEGAREQLVYPSAMKDLASSVRYGWLWRLIVFNTDQDFAPFEIKSCWNYLTSDKAHASGKVAAKLLGVKLKRENVAVPHSTEAIEYDKKSAAWHDGTRIDSKPVGRRHL